MATIVITGSTKGIGKGLAQEFFNQGHQVVVSGRNQDDANQCANDIGKGSDKVIAVACDTTDKAQVEQLWQAATDRFGAVDIWINNAGLARTVWSILDTPDDEVNTMVTTNMLGTINCCKVVANGMKQQGGGKIFNMLGGGSDGEYFPGMGIYGTTKRGLDYFTNALSKELKDDHILVGKIRPGMIITEGVIREAKADWDNFQKRRKFANVLCDKVETVAPFLVTNILNFNKTGKKIAWLNPRKMTLRLLGSLLKKPKDKFAEFGL
ncbi:SDR family oxidoreductase [Thalassotalea sp. HSM 43]|uniref:SDR family NAD(P)-dependent oxidoreductase n=1 Tax=Thalassotalea sp. HSM 43 TaxID=2552945 RepID=UPI00108152C2|nr:SDR family oxidoreductase [Thalassotalea sp. HSM 43]QBY04540.1 SDR family oxidoreductase [Thalassotalea sp. HSM 43]